MTAKRSSAQTNPATVSKRLALANRPVRRRSTPVQQASSAPVTVALVPSIKRPSRADRRRLADFERKLLRRVQGVIQRLQLSERMKHRRLITRLPEMVSAYVAGMYKVKVAYDVSVAAFQKEADEFLKAKDPKLVALIREVAKSRKGKLIVRGRKLPGAWFDQNGQLQTQTPTLSAMLDMARSMRVDRPIPPARRVCIPKQSNDARRSGSKAAFRETFDFALPTRALQRMVLDIFESVAPENEFDFGRPGAGGKDGAAKAIQDAIYDGCTYFVVADIANAFPSTKIGHVVDLIPLPQRVIQNVLCPDTTARHEASASIRSDASCPPQATTARCLPQGAVTSAAIMSALLGRVLRPLAGSNRVIVVIADDIAIGARTREGAEQALLELQSALRSLRAGPLDLGRVAIQSPDEQNNHVQFAGYRHRYFDDTCRLHCVPSDKAIRRMRDELARKLHVGPHDRLEYVREKYFDAWRGTFREWTVNWRSFKSLEDTTINVMFSVQEALKAKGRAPSLWPTAMTFRLAGPLTPRPRFARHAADLHPLGAASGT